MKNVFLNNLGLLFSARESVLNTIQNEKFSIKNFDKIPTCEPTTKAATKPTKHKKSKLKLQKELMNEFIATKKIQMVKHFGIILSIRIHHY